MKKLTLILYMIVFSVLFANAQWIQITLGTVADLEAIHFIDAQTGFCSGPFTPTLETNDGGNSWTVGSSQGFKDFSFFNDTHGYGASVVSQSMAKTTNGGTSWISITPPNLNSLWGVSATSETTAYFVGTGGVLMKTSNGGLTITVLNSGTINQLNDVVFTNATTGFIVTQVAGIKKTEDSGISWNTVYNPPPGTLMTEMYFVDDNLGFALGSDGLVTKTTDAGQSWTNLTTNSNGYLQGVNFFNANNGLVVGISGEILFTNDGGTTWYPQNSETSEHLMDVFMLSATSAIVCGDNGTILKNDNIVAGIGENLIGSNINVYPNPTSSIFTIEKPPGLKKEIEIRVLDTESKLLTKVVMPTHQRKMEIDVSNFSNGLYYLHLITEDKSIVKSVVKK